MKLFILGQCGDQRVEVTVSTGPTILPPVEADLLFVKRSFNVALMAVHQV
jgi:hypothetical protein